MFRFQYSVMTKASRARAWEIFSNWRRWNEFANVYGELHWREGKPWEAGSRMEIELKQPVSTVVTHVITSCQPAHKVGWIDHSLGVVLAQWVHFEELVGGGTRVHTWGDIVHSGDDCGTHSGTADHQLYRDVVREFSRGLRPDGGSQR
jgi:hypothetical protein